MSGFTNGFYGIVVLGTVIWVRGTVGYFTISTQIPQIRKVDRIAHDQDIVPEKWSSLQQSNNLRKTAKRMHQLVFTLRCFHINENGGFKK